MIGGREAESKIFLHAQLAFLLDPMLSLLKDLL